MKKYLMPFGVLGLALFLCYYFFDESQRGFGKAKSAYESLMSQVDSAKRQRDASSDQIVALNKSVKDSVDFLAQWKAYYLANKDYESLIGRAAEKAKCVVIERKWESQKASIGKLDYPVECFVGTVVGDYKDIVNFIGQLESQQQLATISNIEFKEGIGGVACTLNVWMPEFEDIKGKEATPAQQPARAL